MKIVRVCLVAIVVAFCGLVLCPGITRADDLTGSTGISSVANGTTYFSDTIAVGSSLSCPGTSAICNGYFGYGSETFSVGTSSISYSVSNYPGTVYMGTSNGFDFTGLTFAGGDQLTGVTVATTNMGLTDSDITFGPSSIFINLVGLPINGYFTLDLTSGPAVATPEPSSLMLLGIGLLALIGFAGKRFASDRFAIEPAR